MDHKFTCKTCGLPVETTIADAAKVGLCLKCAYGELLQRQERETKIGFFDPASPGAMLLFEQKIGEPVVVQNGEPLLLNITNEQIEEGLKMPVPDRLVKAMVKAAEEMVGDGVAHD